MCCWASPTTRISPRRKASSATSGRARFPRWCTGRWNRLSCTTTPSSTSCWPTPASRCEHGGGAVDLGLTDRVVIVTGGASNIGRAISQEFAREGAVVAIFDRDEAMAKKTASDMEAKGGRVGVYTVDLTDVEATGAAARSVEADVGPVAVLVNNVGW